MDKIDLLSEQMKEFGQILKAVLNRVDETDAKLDSLAMDVHHIKGDVEALKSDVAILKSDVAIIKRDTSDLKEGQERHERLLEKLALRSIEYEMISKGERF